jgi:hypothetical protein
MPVALVSRNVEPVVVIHRSTRDHTSNAIQYRYSGASLATQFLLTAGIKPHHGASCRSDTPFSALHPLTRGYHRLHYVILCHHQKYVQVVQQPVGDAIGNLIERNARHQYFLVPYVVLYIVIYLASTSSPGPYLNFYILLSKFQF